MNSLFYQLLFCLPVDTNYGYLSTIINRRNENKLTDQAVRDILADVDVKIHVGCFNFMCAPQTNEVTQIIFVTSKLIDDITRHLNVRLNDWRKSS